MAVRRVFVIWTHPIFHESVRLLVNHPEIEWVGASSDYEAARHEIQTLQPDTILVEETRGNVPDYIVKIFKATPWNARVVGFSLEDNHMHVYYREERTVEQAKDLLTLILRDFPTI